MPLPALGDCDLGLTLPSSTFGPERCARGGVLTGVRSARQAGSGVIVLEEGFRRSVTCQLWKTSELGLCRYALPRATVWEALHGGIREHCMQNKRATVVIVWPLRCVLLWRDRANTRNTRALCREVCTISDAVSDRRYTRDRRDPKVFAARSIGRQGGGSKDCLEKDVVDPRQ